MPVHLSLDYHRQHFVASYVLNDSLGRELRSQYPSLGSTAIAKHGLRQWLRLHILAPESLVVPSRAVFLLWHEFVGSRDFDDFAHHAYRHLGERRPSPDALRRRPVTTDTAGLALSFAMACADEGALPEHPSNLPTLFRVDDALALEDGQHWALNCGHSVCQPKDGPGAFTTSWAPTCLMSCRRRFASACLSRSRSQVPGLAAPSSGTDTVPEQ